MLFSLFFRSALRPGISLPTRYALACSRMSATIRLQSLLTLRVSWSLGPHYSSQSVSTYQLILETYRKSEWYASTRSSQEGEKSNRTATGYGQLARTYSSSSSSLVVDLQYFSTSQTVINRVVRRPSGNIIGGTRVNVRSWYRNLRCSLLGTWGISNTTLPGTWYVPAATTQ